MTKLVLFDLDDTLLAGDSDYEWGAFLADAASLDRAAYDARNQEFYDRYRAGTLDLQEFLDFQLAPLTRYPRATLEAWRAEFVRTRIAPIVRPGARGLLDSHRDGVRVIVTATNRFVTAPIAELLGIDDLVATELEEVDGRFTGHSRGTPCFREGKVARVEEWLAARGERWSDYAETWFYSDSINDLPLLSRVTQPRVVHPDDRLRACAAAHGWPLVSLDQSRVD